MWKAPKSQEDTDESAMGQAARRVSIIEGSAEPLTSQEVLITQGHREAWWSLSGRKGVK